jgi:hypothetical protein
LSYIVSKKSAESPLQRDLNRHINQGSFSAVARHLGCNTVAVIQFSKGKEDALTLEQQQKLASLIIDMETGKWNAKPRLTGFQTDDAGNITWNSGLKR